MDIINFLDKVHELGVDFYTGVPDSQLKALCDHLMETYGVGDHHVVAVNEGAAVGLAAGHYLSAGKPALVYMQNSGIGNAVNPVCSLLNEKVYAIPVLFVVGWRGEPGVHDEPQHLFQGEITTKLLACLNIKYFVLTSETDDEVLEAAMKLAREELDSGRCFAFVVKKGALKKAGIMNYESIGTLSREEITEVVIEASSKNDIFVSTTGKLSRELFEIREKRNEGHGHDFLTVGSMGHSSMIALGVAKRKPKRKVCCLDGDGSILMHMGSLATIGAQRPANFLHILINNGAHETVGGIPTVSNKIELIKIAKACGYRYAVSVDNKINLVEAVNRGFKEEGPAFIEVKANLCSRSDLGRPTTTPIENKQAFMTFVQEGDY